jgi:hypothetical protein
MAHLKFSSLHSTSVFSKGGESNGIVNDKLRILEENETKKKILK